MYRGEHARAQQNAALARDLSDAASAASRACTRASHALLTLRNDAAFRQLVNDHRGLLQELPASLVNLVHSDRADSVLCLSVARAALRPWMMRVEVLGWLANAHPDALLTLVSFLADEPAVGTGRAITPPPASGVERTRRRRSRGGT